MSTSQKAVMLCSWGVKAGMVGEWVAGKSVIPLLSLARPCMYELIITQTMNETAKFLS